MKKEFRQAKYLNESGTQQGRYFMNRLNYFEFHRYPEYKKHLILSILASVLMIFLIIELLVDHFLFSLVLIYLLYISATSCIILLRRICPLLGYLFYPKSWIKFFKDREIEANLDDYDSIATLSHHDINNAKKITKQFEHK